ncbi:MAG TPA: rhomboid family intramembrane serine protease [Bacteroidia bacterium]|jgi:membrane associated rhomboid family serine protease|nr:rhomboid family intramembrane serine protease [Bacteroidia bacterium]
MITTSIIVACIAFSFWAFNDANIFTKFLFSPYATFHNKQYYRLFTHAFLHGDYMHLAFNMYALYLFGQVLEEQYFPMLFQEKAVFYYILLYVGGIFFSSLYDFIKQRDNPNYSSVGASGAVTAIVFSAILINPTMGMGILFIPFFIPAWSFGGLYLIYSWYMGKRQLDNIGHNAHFWGAVFGFVFTILLKPALLPRFFSEIF